MSVQNWGFFYPNGYRNASGEAKKPEKYVGRFRDHHRASPEARGSTVLSIESTERENCCLRMSANVSEEQAERDVDYLTGRAHSCQNPATFSASSDVALTDRG